MKPVAIFRHSAGEGPGYFATYLESHALPWVLIRIDAGDPVPTDVYDFSGLAFMGGPMSVNDDLPWIPAELQLIRQAVDANVPVIGHCLGGQLMAKALGGAVTRNPAKEIGWGAVTAAQTPAAAAWLGEIQEFLSFHWHGETFSLPPGAEPILSSDYCAHQAFVLGPHLAMQCHVEMTPTMIRAWCESGANEIAHAQSQPSVQQPQDMQRDMDARVAALHAVADRLYGRWIAGLAR